jgi:hypothetical protein
MHKPGFAGIFDNTDFDAAKDENARQALRNVLSRQAMAALADEDGKTSLTALRKYAFEDNKPDDFQSAELAKIFTEFRRHKSWEDMLRLVDESANEDFSRAPIIREFCAVACNMTGQYDLTLQICQKLLDEGLGNGEVYGAMGKAWLKKDDLEKSSYYYEQGFLCDFETYPGINVAYREIERGNPDRARDIAKILQMASIRDGVQDSHDYWAHAIAFESAAIGGADRKEIDAIFDRMQSLVGNNLEPWMLESSLAAMKRVAPLMTADSFAYTIKRLEGALTKTAFKNAADPDAAASAPEPDLLRGLKEASFSYRGLASNFIGQNFVSGNFRFGGQLPDHSLTRTDWAQFQNLLRQPLAELTGDTTHTKTLGEISDTSEFMRAADAVVRRAFSTDRNELEDLTSDGHSRYDESVYALLKLSGIEGDSSARRHADSRTNISVIMGLGLGDCRHHAQAKQLLFDVWQKEHMNQRLANAYQALKDGDQTAFAHEIKEFKAIEAQELRTFDVVVKAPIKVNGPYSPAYDATGSMVADENSAMNVVEEHTMTILLQSGANHKVESVRFADSFYQNHYEWGDGAIPLKDILFDGDGTLVLPAKTIETRDPATGNIIHMPVELHPTPYAGKRDQASGDEHGKLLLLGLPVPADFSLADKLSQTPAERGQRLGEMRDWYMAAGEIPEVLQRRFKSTAPAPGGS